MSRVQVISLLVAIFACSASGKSVIKLHPDVGLDVFELSAKYGYPLEHHEVETEDGYLLGMHRIPHGKNNKDLANRPPVLMMHGLLSCSADWINTGPEKSLAFLLADLGYDVWLGNARGNAESRKHKTLDPDVNIKEFWSYSWNEIGQLDIPAKIDYILAHTGAQKLQYVGFSQGTTTFFVMASTRPEYNDKITMALLLAPVAEMTHMKHPLVPLAQIEEQLYKYACMFGIYEILPRTEFLFNLSNELCQEGKWTQEICKIVIWAIAGYDRAQLDGDFIPVITTTTPAGTNWKQYIHYGQVVKAKEFRQFDYHNDTLNMELYGSVIPPKYDLTKITVPVAMYYGENDWMASEIDAINISKMLPNLIFSKLVNYTAFNHLDFIWSIDIMELLYNDALEAITTFK